MAITAATGREIDPEFAGKIEDVTPSAVIPLRLLPPIDEAGLEPPPDPPLPADAEKEVNKQ